MFYKNVEIVFMLVMPPPNTENPWADGLDCKGDRHRDSDRDVFWAFPCRLSNGKAAQKSRCPKSKGPHFPNINGDTGRDLGGNSYRGLESIGRGVRRSSGGLGPMEALQRPPI